MPCLSTPRAPRLVIFTLLALFSLPFMSASAQETGEPETYELRVAALLCLDSGCVEFGDRVSDFTITAVEIGTGETIDSCVTAPDGQWSSCTLVVPVDAQWTLTYDEAQTPAGYTYLGSILGVEGGSYGSITYLPFVPVDQPELTELSVAAVLCTDAECQEFGDRLGDVTITAVDSSTRETLGMCTTTSGTETQTCQLEVPVEANLEFIADEANIPAGYTFFGSVITIEDGPHGPITYLPFVPAGPIEEPGHIVVQAALCTDASCDEFSQYLDSFLISAVDPETGETFSECMTDNAQQGLDHQCILDVPSEGDFEFEWQADQVPEGYEPFGEPIEAGYPAIITLGFVPADDAPDPTVTPTAPPVKALPSTGTTGPEGTGSSNLGPITLALVTLTLAGTALHLRRR